MAVVILALALTTALSAMQRAFVQFDTARNLGVAANILQCEMEKERLFTWVKVSDATYAPAIDASFARNPAVGGRFTLSRTLATVHAGQTVQVTLTVRWRGYDGRSLTRSYTSYYTQGGALCLSARCIGRRQSPDKERRPASPWSNSWWRRRWRRSCWRES